MSTGSQKFEQGMDSLLDTVVGQTQQDPAARKPNVKGSGAVLRRVRTVATPTAEDDGGGGGGGGQVYVRAPLSLVTEAAHKILSAYLVMGPDVRRVFKNVSDRFHARQGRCAVLTQLSSIEEARYPGTRITMPVSRVEAAVFHWPPLDRMIATYDPATEFVHCVCVVADQQFRGWIECAIVAVSAPVTDAAAAAPPGDERVWQFAHADDSEWWSFDPAYEEEFRNAVLDAVSQGPGAREPVDDLHKQRFRTMRAMEGRVHDQLVSAVGGGGGGGGDAATLPLERADWLRLHADAASLRADLVSRSDRRAHITEGGLDRLLANIARQQWLLNCTATDCARVELKPHEFDPFQCQRCALAVYCSRECRSADAPTHVKGGECKRLVKQMRRVGSGMSPGPAQPSQQPGDGTIPI